MFMAILSPSVVQNLDEIKIPARYLIITLDVVVVQQFASATV